VTRHRPTRCRGENCRRWGISR